MENIVKLGQKPARRCTAAAGACGGASLKGAPWRRATTSKDHPIPSRMMLALVASAVAGILAYQNRLAEEHRLAVQKNHEQRLGATDRQHALEKALLAAMIGDFEGAEEAINAAELLGGSTGQVRGIVAFHRGDVPGRRLRCRSGPAV